MAYKKIEGILSYDSEAYKYYSQGKERQELAYGVFAWREGNKYKTYTIRTPDEFFAFLEDFEGYRLFIHNAKYDLSLLHIGKFRKRFSTAYYDIPLLFKVKVGERGVTILDSMNFLKGKLKNLAKSFLTDEDYQLLGVDKNYKEEVDYELRGEEWNRYIQREGARLAKRDALVLLRIMEKFMEMNRYKNGQLNTAISAPQLAFQKNKEVLREELKDNLKLFKKIYYDIHPKLNSDEVMESYKGGRVDALVVTNRSESLNFFDVNSLYPTVMLHFEYPYDFQEETTGDEDLVSRYQNHHLGIHQVTWDCGDLPVIPVVTRVKMGHDDVITQARKGQDWITTPELEVLREECEVTVKRNVWFKTYPIFRSFVQKYYQLKEESKKGTPEYLYYKLLLNSAYGKWGQHKSRRVTLEDEEVIAYLDRTMKNEERKEVNGVMITKIDEGFYTFREELEKRNNMAIASLVTGFARVYLYHLMKMMNYEVYYCDTDSIATKREAPSQLNFEILGVKFSQPFLDDKLLGSLKREKEGSYVILGKKMYYKTEEQGEWVPRDFKLVGENVAEGVRKEQLVIKGIDMDSFVQMTYSDNPFQMTFKGTKNKPQPNWREVTEGDVTKVAKPHPRLNYVKEGDVWRGYPL